MNTPNLVAWRKSHGSLCHVCPLNGQRKVGCDGALNAEHIATGDFPSEEDSQLGLSRGERYGRAYQDKVGYFTKLEHIARNQSMLRLLRVEGRKWPRLSLHNTLLMFLIMCHIPGPKRPAIKIKTPIARAAIRCCANSWRALHRKLLAENPNRMLILMGSDVLSVFYRTKLSIEAHRGRVMPPLTKEDIDRLLAPEPEAAIYKFVLRGKKPWDIDKAMPEVAWGVIEYFLNVIIKAQRVGVRKVARHGLTPPPEWNTTRGGIEWVNYDQPTNLWLANHALILDIILKKQIAALRKRAKKEGQQQCLTVIPMTQHATSSV